MYCLFALNRVTFRQIDYNGARLFSKNYNKWLIVLIQNYFFETTALFLFSPSRLNAFQPTKSLNEANGRHSSSQFISTFFERFSNAVIQKDIDLTRPLVGHAVVHTKMFLEGSSVYIREFLKVSINNLSSTQTCMGPECCLSTDFLVLCTVQTMIFRMTFTLQGMRTRVESR